MKLFLMTFLFAVGAHATTVVCTGEVQGDTHAIRVTLDTHGKIATWHETKSGAAAEQGPFFLFVEKGDVNEDEGEEGPMFEYMHSEITSYGMKTLILGTTADEVKLSITRDLTRGAISYRDHGSGNGDEFTRLTCKEILK